MFGLIKKEWYLIRSMAKSYLVILGLFLALTLMGAYNVTFLALMFLLMSAMMPMTTYALDETAHWDRFAAALPRGRNRVVGAKYLFFLSAQLLTLCLLGVIGLILPLAGQPVDWNELGFTCGVGLAMGCLFGAIQLPLVFRLGAQKARLGLIAMVAALTLGMGLLLSAMNISAQTLAVLAQQYWWLALASIGLVLFASYALSLHIYRSKEF